MPPNTGGPASPEEIKQTGFDLIVAMMREEETVAPVIPGARAEKCVSQVACAGFQREFRLRGIGANIGFAQFERIAQFPGSPAGKERIRVPCRSAQTMIQMTDDQLPVAELVQSKQQRHRVSPAGNPDKILSPWRGNYERRAQLLEQVNQWTRRRNTGEEAGEGQPSRPLEARFPAGRRKVWPARCRNHSRCGRSGSCRPIL